MNERFRDAERVEVVALIEQGFSQIVQMERFYH